MVMVMAMVMDVGDNRHMVCLLPPLAAASLPEHHWRANDSQYFQNPIESQPCDSPVAAGHSLGATHHRTGQKQGHPDVSRDVSRDVSVVVLVVMMVVVVLVVTRHLMKNRYLFIHMYANLAQAASHKRYLAMGNWMSKTEVEEEDEEIFDGPWGDFE